MLKQLVGKLIGSTAGSATVEYAFVLPIMLLFIVGTVEYDLVMYASGVLEGATLSAAREAKTGYVPTNMTQLDYINSIVQTRVGGLLNPNNLVVSSYAYDQFNNVTTPSFINCAPLNYTPPPAPAPTLPPCPSNLGSSGQIVVYTVTYPWPIFTPLMQRLLGTYTQLPDGSWSWVYNIKSSAVVKNEPYSVSAR